MTLNGIRVIDFKILDTTQTTNDFSEACVIPVFTSSAECQHPVSRQPVFWVGCQLPVLR